MITANEARKNASKYYLQTNEKYPVFKATCKLKQRDLEKRIISESKEGRSYYIETFPLAIDKTITYNEARYIIEDMFEFLTHYGYELDIWLNDNTIRMKVSWF